MMKRCSGSIVVGDTKLYGVVDRRIGGLGLDKELWSVERLERRVVPGLGPAASTFAGELEIVDLTTRMRNMSLFYYSLADSSECEAERQRSVEEYEVAVFVDHASLIGRSGFIWGRSAI